MLRVTIEGFVQASYPFRTMGVAIPFFSKGLYCEWFGDYLCISLS
jgi:hypothetical protein